MPGRRRLFRRWLWETDLLHLLASGLSTGTGPTGAAEESPHGGTYSENGKVQKLTYFDEKIVK